MIGGRSIGLVLLFLGVIVAQNGTSQLKGGPGSDALGTKSKMEVAGLDKTEQSEGTRSQGQSRADAEASISGSESSRQSKSTSSRSGSALTIRSRTSGGTPIKKKKGFPWQPIVFTLLMIVLAALVARGTWAGLAYVDRRKMANTPSKKADDEKTPDPSKKKTGGDGGKGPGAGSKLRAPPTEGTAPGDKSPPTESDGKPTEGTDKGWGIMEWMRERVLPEMMGGYPVAQGGKPLPMAAKVAAGVATVGTVGYLTARATGTAIPWWDRGTNATVINGTDTTDKAGDNAGAGSGIPPGGANPNGPKETPKAKAPADQTGENFQENNDKTMTSTIAP